MKALGLVLLLTGFAIEGVRANDKQSTGLVLEVHARVQRVLPAVGGADRVFVVHSLLRNVGTKPITIPTRTENGHPSLALRLSDQEFLAYCVSPSEIEGQKVKLSQFAFFPVTLKPGELATLPTYVSRGKGGIIQIPTEARVVYEVDSDMAELYGWWCGQLDVAAKVEEEKD